MKPTHLSTVRDKDITGDTKSYLLSQVAPHYTIFRHKSNKVPSILEIHWLVVTNIQIYYACFSPTLTYVNAMTFDVKQVCSTLNCHSICITIDIFNFVVGTIDVPYDRHQH